MKPDDVLSTHELALDARRAPADGFSTLYGRVAPALIVWARLHLREPLRAKLDPEDVLQETATRAWSRFGEFDPNRAGFRAWIFGIARNVLAEALQRIGTQHGGAQHLSTDGMALVPDDTTSLTRAVARRESLATFASHIERLPREDQRLLLYRGLEERTHDEVATLLATTAEAAAKRWQRLRERLIAECGGDEFLAA